MSSNAIIFPAISLAFITFGVCIWMGRLRFRALRNGDVKPTYFKLYDSEPPPDGVVKVSHNYDNLLALPMLFYVVVILIYVTNSTGVLKLALAWVFVLSRAVHSVIHTTSNKLVFRFYSFLIGLMILSGMWFVLLIELLSV